MKVLITIFTLFFIGLSYGQNYAYYIVYEANPNFAITNVYDINQSFIIDNVSYPAGDAFFEFIHDGINTYDNIAHIFVSLPSTFSTLTLNVYGQYGVQPNDVGCLDEETYTYITTPLNFNYHYYNTCPYHLTLYPLHITPPNASNSPICEDDEIILDSGWDWQYSVDGGVTWINFLSASQQAIIRPSQLPNWDSTYLGSIKFRTGYNNNYTNIVTYTIVGCSPQLLDFTSIDTLCSYSNDGGFSMILDRDVPQGQNLVVSLFYEFNAGTGVFSFLTQKDTSTLIPNADGTFTYVWPTNIFPIQGGNYKVKYQTLNIVPPSNDPSWNSLIFSSIFTVSSPPPIFISGSSQNVNCFIGSDGIIQLNASGGVGAFTYEINGNNNWIPFSNPNTHTISNNTQGVYNIKIKDANGCTEQQ